MAQRDYDQINNYNRSVYDKFTLMLPKGRKADLQKCANIHGKSMTQLIIDALERCYDLDLSKADGE